MLSKKAKIEFGSGNVNEFVWFSVGYNTNYMY
jgi:hypothetical protein